MIYGAVLTHYFLALLMDQTFGLSGCQLERQLLRENLVLLALSHFEFLPPQRSCHKIKHTGKLQGGPRDSGGGVAPRKEGDTAKKGKLIRSSDW